MQTPIEEHPRVVFASTNGLKTTFKAQEVGKGNADDLTDYSAVAAAFVGHFKVRWGDAKVKPMEVIHDSVPRAMIDASADIIGVIVGGDTKCKHLTLIEKYVDASYVEATTRGSPMCSHEALYLILMVTSIDNTLVAHAQNVRSKMWENANKRLFQTASGVLTLKDWGKMNGKNTLGNNKTPVVDVLSLIEKK
jgi:hypothetical protein